MKIVIVNGQNHKGSTYNIGKLLVDKISGEKEITEFFLPRDLNHFCLGCYKCLDNDEACYCYEEKRKITKAIEEADVLVFTTPNYCYLPSAPMTAFIDLTFNYWMVHRPRECMFSKKAVVISTTAGAGANKAIDGIAKALFYWGVPYILKYGLAVQAKNWSEVKPEKRAKIECAVGKLAKKLSNGKKPHVGIKTRFIFKAMGGMQKAGWGSSPTERVYWEQMGWFGKERPWKKSKAVEK